jgi:predicted phosphodiesterase
VRINYFSDIHLEFGRLELPETNADIVIAAGDIGVGRQGVNWLKGIAKPVIYIAGNHEFYTHEYKRTLNMLRYTCANSNIYFLEKNVLIMDGVRFLGCTLWTDLLVEGSRKSNEISTRLNDFRNIHFKEGFFNQAIFTRLHRTSILWLEHELNQPFDGKTIVITHHAPLQKSWHEGNSELKKIAYYSTLNALINKYDITAWFHGHIHRLNDYIVTGTRVLSNTRGYKSRREVENFDQNKVIDL